jgi:protein-tyrosine phosphatase
VPILERFAAGGVRRVVCTPHLDASQADVAPIEAHRVRLAELQAAVPMVELLPGWEIMLDRPGATLDRPGLTLGASRAVLVEFSRGGVPRGAVSELRRLVHGGLVPILAHPERYYGCTIALIEELRATGVVIQTDVTMLRGRGEPSRVARDLLARGLVDVLASDNHGDARSLVDGVTWLRAHGAGDEQVQLLTAGNAERILANRDPVPVPPLATGPLLERLARRLAR